MKHYCTLALAAISLATLTSCGSKLGALSPDNFTVTPSPLETAGNDIPFTLNGHFPEKYMAKKAVVTIIPELRSKTTDKIVVTQNRHATFQGEKVVGNDQVVAYKTGGSFTLKDAFAYDPALSQSELYLTFDARVGKKKVNIPAVKVANGLISTSQLVYQTVQTANTATAADAYQQQIAQQQEAQIKYLVNQSKVRTSELNSTSVKDFVQILREIKTDKKGYALDNIEISAYASPEGALNFNERLAENRQISAEQYVNTQLKKTQLNTDIDTKFTAEDWNGFQELVSQSNIQDKDVILRVLSMYQDPEEREQQIKNLSVAFRELADEVLPELRRARMTINYRLIGRTDAEIQAQLNDDPGKLSVEELLYAATLTNDWQARKAIFETTAQLYPNDRRAQNGLAQVAFAQGDYAAAKAALAQAGGSAEANANAALIALKEGNITHAEDLLANALTAPNYAEVLGNVQLAKGQFSQAAQSLKGIKTTSSALAQILDKDYVSARATLDALPADRDAMVPYLKAILNTRTQNLQAAAEQLQAAQALNPTLVRQLIDRDALELAKVISATATAR